MPRAESAGYALLRVVYGLVVLTHGIPKALRIPHGSMGDPFSSTASLIHSRLGLPFEYPLILGAMAAFFALRGGDCYSVDGLMRYRSLRRPATIA